MRLTANWIWFDHGTAEEAFARARKRFDLNERPQAAELKITCSGRYLLWINGQQVARGPARAPAWKKRYDVLDVAHYLQPGKNVIAVRVAWQAYATALCPEMPPGLWCQLDCPAGRIETDADWRMSSDPCFATGTGRRNTCYGPIEIYDARAEEAWQGVEYEDAAWQRAIVLQERGVSGPRISPWTDLIPRGIPQEMEEELRPVRVVRVGEVIEQEFSPGGFGVPINLGTYLLHDVPLEPEFASVEDAEASIENTDTAAVVSQPSPLDQSQPHLRNASVIFDFGREITGYGWIDVEGNPGAIVDVAYSERLIAGRVQAVVQNASYADRYILGEGRRRHEVYDWKGYRYVQLTFRNLTQPLKLYGVGCTFMTYPVQHRGRFESSDGQLDKIWETGAYTQQLCMHDALMDCPWREQMQWLGDGRVQLLIVQNAFGDIQMPRKFIEQFAESQISSGMMPMVAPGRRSYIADYALWWVQGLLDVLLMEPDHGFARRMLPHLRRLLSWFEPFEDADGLLTDVPGWIFIDWANVGKTGVCAPLNATYAIALRAAAQVAAYIDDADLQTQCAARIEHIAGSYHERFWNDARGLYVDNVVAGRQTESFSQHTQAISVLAGLAETDAAALMQRTASDASLVQTEPYFTFYLLEALAQTGEVQAGLDLVRGKWGGMIEQGATSFWEEWQVTGTFRGGQWLARPRSHCHAWSAAPPAWLSRHVLGVRVESLTEDRLIVQPGAGDLSEARGVVPTRFGPVEVQWRRIDDRLRVQVKLPADVATDLRDARGFDGRTDYQVDRG